MTEESLWRVELLQGSVLQHRDPVAHPHRLVEVDGCRCRARMPCRLHVSSIAECERRDVKGLYAKARKGEIKEFTGVSAPFEAPERPDLSLDTSVLSVEQSVSRLLELIVPKVEIKH